MSSARKRGGRSGKNDKKSAAGEQPGLRELVQRRILDDVFQSSGEKHPGWKVLIVDDPAMKVISSAVGMYDIMERKVTIVESLDKKRAPFPDMAAIYLIEPSHDSISKLIEDFSGEKTLYGDAVFVYCLSRLPDALLENIKNCRPLLKRIKGLSEINVDFLAKEERAFTLDMRDAFTSFHLRKGPKSVEAKVAERLVTVCATLNEYPHIRYRQSSSLATKIANVFHRKMDDFVSQNPTWWYHGGPSKGKSSSKAKRERGVLLLADRADDCLTPLMHDFTYQAMIHDLLKMDGDRITYHSETADDSGETEAKDVLLDERDKLWVEIRGKHIAEVIETLSNRIRDIMNSSTGSSLTQGGGNMSLSQMASALKALPEYKEVMSKLSQHMHLSHECMDVFRRENLLDLSELEQSLATGKDDEGRSPKFADLIDQVDDFLIRIKSLKDRLRLVLITTISQGGLRSQDRRRLVNSAELTRKDVRTLNSLELLGLNIFSSSSSNEGAQNKLVSMFGGDRNSGNDNLDEDAEYAASRYVPALKAVVERLCTNELDFDNFPSVMPMPDMGPSSTSSGSRGGRSGRGKKEPTSARSGGATSARKKGGVSSKWSKASSDDSSSAKATRFTGGRNIVFMLGGISYSEIKHVRQVSQNLGREIIIGSTNFLTAEDFIDDLTELGKDDE